MGKPKSIEHRKKISESLMGRKMPWVSEANHKKKGVKLPPRTKEHVDGIRQSRIKNGSYASIGDTYIDSRGYVCVKVTHGCKYNYRHLHRVLMEEKIGRPLAKSEVVHHIDGDKQYNDINNLALLQTIGKSISVGGDVEVHDASGLLVFPGGVDVHTHLDWEFGPTHTLDTFGTGTKSAAFGGTTTLVDFCNQTVGESPLKGLEGWHKRRESACVDVGAHMIMLDVNAKSLEDMKTLIKREGVTSFNLFMAYPGVLMLDDGSIFKAMRVAGANGAMTCMHAENGQVIQVLVQEAVDQGLKAPKYQQYPQAVDATTVFTAGLTTEFIAAVPPPEEAGSVRPSPPPKRRKEKRPLPKLKIKPLPLGVEYRVYITARPQMAVTIGIEVKRGVPPDPHVMLMRELEIVESEIRDMETLWHLL